MKSLGDVRLLVAEVLFAVIEADSNYSTEAVNCIHDSTFHILISWALEKRHNSIFLSKYTKFFKIFCKRANNVSLINSFIKTNLVSDLGGFALHKLFAGNESLEVRMDCLYFFKELVESMVGIEAREECAVFNTELNKSVNWKYLKDVFW